MIGLIIFILGIALLSSTIAIHLILSIEMTCTLQECATGYNFYSFPFFELLITSIVISISGIILKMMKRCLILSSV